MSTLIAIKMHVLGSLVVKLGNYIVDTTVS
jgi:hypothetical protein